MSSDSETPKLHIDSDWKAQAQAEKERLTQQEEELEKKKEAGGEGRGPLPKADFRALMGTLASQAIMGLGAYADPQTGRVMIDLEGSKFAIDLLEVLEEKTQGNLSDEEASEIKQVLVELRAKFVQVNGLVAQQMAKQATEGGETPAPATS